MRIHRRDYKVNHRLSFFDYLRSFWWPPVHYVTATILVLEKEKLTIFRLCLGSVELRISPTTPMENVRRIGLRLESEIDIADGDRQITRIGVRPDPAQDCIIFSELRVYADTDLFSALENYIRHADS